MIRKRKTPLLIWSIIIPCILSPLYLSVSVAAEEEPWQEKRNKVVSGVEFDNFIEIGQERLELIGAGLLRYMIIMKGYVAAFYLGEGHSRSELFEDIPKCLLIEYFHDIPARGFIKATQHGLEANLTKEDLEGLKPQIDQLYGCYEDIKKRDRYLFIYIPGRGSELILNGKTLCRFEGNEFANAVLSLWLGKNPINEDLKEHLLGLK